MIFGLVGPNGAVKSTLMRILATLEKSSSGTVLVNVSDILKKPNEIRRILGYLPQEVDIYSNLTVMEFLTYFAAIKGLDQKQSRMQIHELLDILNFELTNRKYLAISSWILNPLP